MSVLAATRPTEWDFPLFLHVLGAFVLIGGALVATAALATARGEAAVLRVGYLGLAYLGLPGYVLMRAGAQWSYAKEGWDDLPDDPTWIGIGFMVADGGALLLLVAIGLGIFGWRRARAGGGVGMLRWATILGAVILVADLVAVWAMAGKPS
jgi:hypothetical protein